MAFHDIISNLFALKINIELIRATSLQMPKEFFPNKNDFLNIKLHETNTFSHSDLKIVNILANPVEKSIEGEIVKCLRFLLRA